MLKERFLWDTGYTEKIIYNYYVTNLQYIGIHKQTYLR